MRQDDNGPSWHDLIETEPAKPFTEAEIAPWVIEPEICEHNYARWPGMAACLFCQVWR